MKRREFLRGVAATAGAAAVPIQVAAKVATHATAKIIPFHYGWACVFAQMNKGITAADIERVFKISSADAHGLMDRMLMRGVLRPAGLDGRSHATRTWEPWDKRQPVQSSQSNETAQDEGATFETGKRARKKFAAFINGLKVEPIYST